MNSTGPTCERPENVGGVEFTAAYLGWPHPELAAPLAALVFGIAIIGAAFVLSWAAEAAQVDISAGLAIALLALLAVLPEYAVDFVFTYQAGQVYEATGMCVVGPDGANPCSLALANMTGANRVLVGVGWPLVVLVATISALRWRRAGGEDSPSAHPGRGVAVGGSQAAQAAQAASRTRDLHVRPGRVVHPVHRRAFR